MIIVGMGTAGSGVGTSMRVKEIKPKVKVVGVTPGSEPPFNVPETRKNHSPPNSTETNGSMK